MQNIGWKIVILSVLTYVLVSIFQAKKRKVEKKLLKQTELQNSQTNSSQQ
jgi:hypothetical protein